MTAGPKWAALSRPALLGVAHSLVKLEAGLVSLGTVTFLLEGDLASVLILLLFVLLPVVDVVVLLLLLLLLSFDCACCCRHLALRFLNQT